MRIVCRLVCSLVVTALAVTMLVVVPAGQVSALTPAVVDVLPGGQPSRWSEPVDVSTGAVSTLHQASGVVSGVYGAGDWVYVVSAQHIERVHRGSGLVERVANGPFSPVGVTGDDGFLYLLSQNGNAPRIDRVDLSTGTMSVVANLTGRVTDITVGPGGDLFVVADSALRRVAKVSGVVSTVTTFPADVSVYGLAADDSRLWVSVASSGGVWSVRSVGVDGTVTTVHDNTVFQGYRMVSAGPWLYGTSNHRVLRIDKATGEVVNVAGTTAAGYRDDSGAKAWFNYPGGIDTDGTSLVVADQYNNRVRVISPTESASGGQPGRWSRAVDVESGQVSTLASGGDQVLGVYVREGIAYYVTTSRVMRVDLATGGLSPLAGQASASSADSVNPTSASLTGSGDVTGDASFLYFSERRSNYSAIRRVDLESGAVSTVTQIYGSFRGLTVGPDGALYVITTVATGTQLRRVDKGTGAMTTVTTFPADVSVYGLAADDSRLWVSVASSGGVWSVRSVGVDGTVTTVHDNTVFPCLSAFGETPGLVGVCVV